MSNFLKKSWLACWVFAFSADTLYALGRAAPPESPASLHSELETLLWLLLFLSTLPAGLLYFLLYAHLVCNFTSCLEGYDFWLGVFVSGYVQWFVLVPRLFGRKGHGLELLDLSSPSDLAQTRGARRHGEAE